MARAYAIIMAGGDGERFWPVSTPRRPKQFVDIFGGKPLIRHAFDRLAGLVPPERVLVVTASRLVPLTRRALPEVPSCNIVGEPCRRDTAAAVAVACGLVTRLGGPDAVGCILTADQLMKPERDFRATLRDAISAAAKFDSIVTMGIVPDRPATGYGYIECGKKVDAGTKTVFYAVRRFVEKPDEATARRYLKAGRFRWNAGMFVWRARVMADAFAAAAPDFSPLIASVASAKSVSALLRRAYPPLRAISVDFAVMEKAKSILVAESRFKWDDVGSWQAIPNHFPADSAGNACIGKTALMDVRDSIVVSSPSHVTAVVGLSDVVVVHTPGATLVCSRSRAQDVKTLVRKFGIICNNRSKKGVPK